MSEVLVKVENVSKKFCRDLKKSLWYGVKDMSSALFSKSHISNRISQTDNQNSLRPAEFWAVKDVSFELKRGECLGLIGHNGAGKSTLLKILNGLIRPDEGKITMHGRIGALIELGAGFNSILTGRENIYNNGAVLGFSKKEIDEKLDAIIEFSEIGDFIDTPVQNYSSGMRVRLGFAVAAQLEPDVLIIDEVLAVGDLAFVLKCLNQIDNMLSNTAVIFVSHSMPMVSRICTQLILMEKGKCIYQSSNVSEGLDIYYSKHKIKLNYGENEKAKLTNVKFSSNNGEVNTLNDTFVINRLDTLNIELTVEVNAKYKAPFVTCTIFDQAQRPFGICKSNNRLSSSKIINDDWIMYKTQLSLSRILLSKGIYSLAVSLSEEQGAKPILRINNATSFQVISNHANWVPIEFEGVWQNL